MNKDKFEFNVDVAYPKRLGKRLRRARKQAGFTFPLLLITLLVGNYAFSAEFQKGVYAYKSGNYTKALREFRSLAEQGDIRAQVNLGVMYDNGQGTLKDYARAHMWWGFAASQGNETAKKYNIIIEKKMSPTDLSNAQRLARECVEKSYKDC